MSGAGAISNFSSGSGKRPWGTGFCANAVESKAIEAKLARSAVAEAVENLILDYVLCVAEVELNVKPSPPTIAAATCGGPGKAIHDPRGIPNRRAGGFS
jgi:hypothetical protein